MRVVVARPLKYDAWVDHPGFGLTPDRVVAIFRTAEQGYPRQQCDLFDDLLENDGTLRNLFEQRRQAVAGKPWDLQPDGADADAVVAARVLNHALRRLPMVDAFDHQLTFNEKGYSATEIDWDVIEFEGRPWVVPVWFANVPARRFAIRAETDELRILTERNRTIGEELVPGKWWVTRRSTICVARAALMRTAAWYALFKRHATRDWYVYAEKFGIPLPIATYDPLVEDQGKDVATEVVENIGNDGGAAVPKGIELKIHDTRSGDASGTHGKLISFCNAEMSKLVNGATLANDTSGQGSYAHAEVHAGIRWEAVQGDAERIQDSFKRHVADCFVRFNSLSCMSPLLEIQVVRDQSPKDLLDAAVKMQKELGVPVSMSQLRRVTGLRGPMDAADAAPGPATTTPAMPEVRP